MIRFEKLRLSKMSAYNNNHISWLTRNIFRHWILFAVSDINKGMWSDRTAHRRKKQLNKNSYVFDNIFQCQATREMNLSIAQIISCKLVQSNDKIF